MGACILCGKSAGFFYSLHKDCFKRYQESETELVKTIEEHLSLASANELAKQLQAQVDSHHFTGEASQRTLIRSLEIFSKKNLERLSADRYQAWLCLLSELSLDESLFIDSNFIAQQENYSLIKSLREGNLPTCNANAANFSVELTPDEVVWWCFSSSHIEQINPKQNQAKWSVIKQILDNMLPAKQKELFEKQEVGHGKIWLTNLGMYFEGNQGVNNIEYRNIFSCTPIKNGIRLQLKELQSRPQSIYCEDGRLLFEFIQYGLKF